MKLLSLLVALSFPLSAWAAPTLSVDAAAKLATAHLKERGLTGQVWITSLTLEADNIQRSNFRWVARYSSEVALEANKKETGLEIAMDGSVARVVRGPANQNPETGKYDPNGSTGLQNPRTRTDRPSILDLKR